MKSSSESDFGDYLSTLKKKTSGNNLDIHIDGLSDFSLSDLSENQNEIKSKFLKNVPTKNMNSDNTKAKSKNKNDKKNIKVNSKEKKKKPKEKEFKRNLSKESDIIFSLSDSSYIPKLQLSNIKSNLADKSIDGDSSFGNDGNRFLKSKKDIQINETQIKDTMKNTWSDDMSSSRNISSPRKSTLRSARSPLNKKKVTILENKQFDSLSSLDFDAQNSSEEVSNRKFDPESDSSDKNFFGMNIMSFNDLIGDEPEEPQQNEISSLIYNGSAKFEKIMSLDDLEEHFSNIETEEPSENVNNLKNSHDNTYSLSEIKTMQNVTPRKMKNLSKRQSYSEIMSISQNDQSEMYSKNSKLYSMNFEESIKEEIQTGSSVSHRKSKKSPSYSSDFTDEDGTLRSVSKINSVKEIHKSNRPTRPKVESIHASLPPELLKEKIDSVPIAQYIVSPEALESLTAYSPSMLLMTNMFRQQLQMTTNFINTQQRLYESLISSLQPTYHYSTLKEFREFVKINKKNIS